MKKLKISKADAKLLGVCAGLGSYFNLDPVFIRVLFVLLTLFSGGIVLIAYFLIYAIVSKED